MKRWKNTVMATLPHLPRSLAIPSLSISSHLPHFFSVKSRNFLSRFFFLCRKVAAVDGDDGVVVVEVDVGEPAGATT